MRWKLGTALGVAAVLVGAGASPAAAEDITVKTLHIDVVVGPQDDQHCDVVGDLYTPKGASAGDRRPAILTTNGFGGSKDDQADFGKAYAARGYVVLSYSGLGFGGSGCKITLDDRDYDGKAASQLVTFLGGGLAAKDGTKLDTVQLDAKGSDGKAHEHDPRVGMIGGSYGGQIQFAVAGIDPRVDTIVPIITWNDLSYSLAPNNTSLGTGVTYATPGSEKVDWVTLFSALGGVNGLSGLAEDPTRVIGCPNFIEAACSAIVQMAITGAPDPATLAFARHASVSTFLDDVRIPTLLAQGQSDTLFNLQEATATYQGLRSRGVPVKMVWKLGGHSGPDAPGDSTTSGTGFQARTYEQWFDHYLRDAPAAPSLDFSYFRDWVTYSGDAAPAYGRAPSYPAVKDPTSLYLSGTDGLTQDKGTVAPGDATFAAVTGGMTSYTETSAVDQKTPVSDTAGTFAQFRTPPLSADTDVIGIPSVTLRVSAPASAAASAVSSTQLVLFAKLYDLAPDGSITLTHRLISPARIATPDGGPVTIQLPGIVHRFPAGHRIALTVSTGDTAYRSNNVPGPVTISTDPSAPGVLSLPIAKASDVGPVIEAAVPAGAGGAGAGARACTSKRAFTVRVKRRYRARLRSARVTVDGKRLTTLKGGRTSFKLKLTGRKASRVTVRIVMTLQGGRRVTDVRRYKTCVAKRR